jgi:urea transport system substrate-binding protein
MKSLAQHQPTRRLIGTLSALGLTLTLASCGGGGGTGGEKTAGTDAGAAGGFDGEVKVGILHSLSGTMAISETTLKEVE